ncbi:carnitine O-acetyltransferase-like isoform X2 [Trichogramma pretiosum]|uniref:carnitine O-acetyltransferase-like isoform X2 n=1 Tax=Trichogramma pretiosum TaxID=7493 RepID=UPI0006C942A9|nr:carnitine O-acetyltransferase-like isoform X2 [Trichogramma pretiosum]
MWNETGVTSRQQQSHIMQRFITNLTSSFNKPMFYGGMKQLYNAQQVAKLTSIELNKHPLPKQPVPDLEKTVHLYLKSVQPLLTIEELKNTERVLHDFVKDGGIGKKLYMKLQQRYEQTDNWMSEWWLQSAYLGYRYPVIVHSSPGTVGPPQEFKSPKDFYRYAAHLIGGVRKYNDMIKSCDIKQEMIRDAPLDMRPYALILGSHRQPNKDVDRLIHIDTSEHIIVLSNNHFFKLSLTSEVNEEQLIASIEDIAQRSKLPGKPIGILTGNDRDIWVEDHNKLKSIGKNEEILKNLETALFVLCLDKELPKSAFSNKNNSSVRGIQSLTGYSSSTNAGNRWHDKIVQYILSYDGFVGLQYEHSPCEALPITVLHDYVLNHVNKKLKETVKAPSDFQKAEHLQFEVDQSLENAIEKASLSVDRLSQDIDLECFQFDIFGSNKIKQCKMSPDSFIQIAMQVTYYQIHNQPPAHYESAALRRFKNARTECIRSTSNESVEFAKLMSNEKEFDETLKLAMIRAVNAHKKLATEASMGEGVDRLFFGLKMIAKEEQIKLPEFFSDISYTKSTSFTLTSSQVAYKTASFMCYGPVVPNGYGCCYNPRSDDIFFACSSFKGCPETSTQRFADTLKQSLIRMIKLADA